MGATIQWREPPEDRPNRSSGEMVSFGGRGDGGRGYMAHSERVGPGVILLHEFFGLQASFKAYADRLNHAGLTVLCPDLYDGSLAGSVDEARTLASSVDVEKTMQKLTAAAAFLTENWHPRVGVLGFSLGADFAVELVGRIECEALVLYYGVGGLAESRWSGPTLGHFASDDEWTPTADAEAAFEAARSRGTEAEMHVYPGTGHWFANESVPDAYDEAAASLAFRRTADWLLHHVA